MLKSNSVIGETKVQLEWGMIEVLKAYPNLSISEAEHVLEKFYQTRYIVLYRGWRVIEDYIVEVIASRQ